MSNWNCSGKVFLITGANSGLGKEIATGIAERGGEVHMLCRSEERGEEARKDISASSKSEQVYLHIVDLSEAASIVNVSTAIQ